MSAKIERYSKTSGLLNILLVMSLALGVISTGSKAQTINKAEDSIIEKNDKAFLDKIQSLDLEDKNVLSKKVFEKSDQRNANRRIWQVEREVESIDPDTKEKQVETIMTDIVEMGNGICYQDDADNWQISVPHWRATKDGFVMDTAGYKLEMGRNIGSWLSCTAKGEEMLLRPSVVEAGDNTDTKVIAELVDEVEGYIDPEDPSRLVFAGAFGKGIDLELIARTDGYGQNVIFRGKPSIPDGVELSKKTLSIRTEMSLDSSAALNSIFRWISRKGQVGRETYLTDRHSMVLNFIKKWIIMVVKFVRFVTSL